MAKRSGKSGSGPCRVYPHEFKEEAVQMLLDGHATGHEPGGELLRQRVFRIVLWNNQDRTGNGRL